MNGVLSLLSDGGAAAVVCSAGADLDALAEAVPEPEEVADTPVGWGVSPWGIDMRGSVVCEIGGSRGCVKMLPVTDAVSVGSDPMGGRVSTGRVIVTSPSLTLIGTGRDTGGTLVAGSSPSLVLIGTGRDTGGTLVAGSSLGVAEPTMVSHSALNSRRYFWVRTCVARLLDADFIAK